MLSDQQMRDFVAQVVSSEGLTLFDIDTPASSGQAILRVFIASADGKGTGITVDQCARVSSRISTAFEFEFQPPIDLEIEVSSPGVNRRLRTEKHFRDALGERVRLVLLEENKKRRVVRGVIADLAEQDLFIEEELAKRDKSKQEQSKLVIPLDRVVEARVDFKFS